MAQFIGPGVSNPKFGTRTTTHWCDGGSKRVRQDYSDQQEPRQAHWLGQGFKVLVTVHPSYLLRMPDRQDKAREYAHFVDDLKIECRRSEVPDSTRGKISSGTSDRSALEPKICYCPCFPKFV
jgi:hypothetical protein